MLPSWPYDVAAGMVWLIALGSDVLLNKNKTKHLGGSGRARGGLADSGG